MSDKKIMIALEQVRNRLDVVATCRLVLARNEALDEARKLIDSLLAAAPDDGQTRPDLLRDFIAKQVTLPEDFERVLRENLWKLYDDSKEEQNAAAVQELSKDQTASQSPAEPASPAAPSATPRTDAITTRMAGELDRPIARSDHMLQMCDHARSLERELSALRATLPKKIGVHDVDEFYKDDRGESGGICGVDEA